MRKEQSQVTSMGCCEFMQGGRGLFYATFFRGKNWLASRGNLASPQQNGTENIMGKKINLIPFEHRMPISHPICGDSRGSSRRNRVSGGTLGRKALNHVMEILEFVHIGVSRYMSLFKMRYGPTV